MADNNKPPWQDASEFDGDGEAPTESRRLGEGRRRLPLAALVVLLVLIGGGIYFAWPAIQDSINSPALDGAVVAKVETAAEVEIAPVPVPADIEAPTPAPEPEPSAALLALSAQVTALEKALAERDSQAAPEPPPAPDLTPLSDALTEAMARVDALEQRLAEAQAEAAARRRTAAFQSGTAAPTADFDTMERLDALEDALNTRTATESFVEHSELESLRAGQAALQEQLAATRELINSLGKREAGDGRTMALILSLTRLSRATATSQPFAREVEALRAAIQSEGPANLSIESAIRDLSAHALNGAPTAAGLSATFDDMALAVIRADGDADDQGWIDATIGRLRRIVTVRRVGGEIVADSLEGRLSALHGALNAGELATAISLAEALPAKARSGAESWLEGARARLAVETALGVLDEEISDRVAARWSGAESTGAQGSLDK